MPSISDIIDDFSLLDDWEDRYRYLIELGDNIISTDDELHNEKNLVPGCASQVWITSTISYNTNNEATIYFYGDSDAKIVKGLVAIAIIIFSGKTKAELINIDADKILTKLGLIEHLTSQRANGFNSLINRIKKDIITKL